MKYLENFIKFSVFDFSQVLELTKDRNLANSIIQNYIKKGYIQRVKRNLYVAISLESDGILPSKFEIASKITNSSYVSHFSAFDFYGYSNQVRNEITVSSLTKFSTFNFEHNTYAYKYSTDDSYVNIINNVKVSSIEKAIVDCIDNLKTYDDLEELLEILTLIPAIDGSKIIEYLVHINKDILFNKVGLILSHFIDNMFLTEHHIDKIKQKSSTLTKYFNNDKHRLNTYYKDWNLYSYNIENILKT